MWGTRDIFDIKVLLENEGLSDEVRKAFIVYLLGHNRPIHEVLAPNLLDKEAVFESELKGMVRIPVTYPELCHVRQELIQRIQAELTEEERRFLISLA